MTDYLTYAVQQLQAAIAKRDDAPCSSMEHEMAAYVALSLERLPTYAEIVEAWTADDHDPLCSEGTWAGDQRMPCDCARSRR